MADIMRMKDITVHLEDHSDEIMEAFRNAVQRGLESIGEKAVAYASDNVKAQGAIDTGRLINSITYATESQKGKTKKYTKVDQEAGNKGADMSVTVDEPDTVLIGTAVFYASYIEYGTGHYSTAPGGGTTKPSWTYRDEFGKWHHAYPQKARPFLKPAIADHAAEYRQVLVDSLKNM